MPRAVVVSNPGFGRSHPERTAAVVRTLADAGWIVEEADVERRRGARNDRRRRGQGRRRRRRRDRGRRDGRRPRPRACRHRRRARDRAGRHGQRGRSQPRDPARADRSCSADRARPPSPDRPRPDLHARPAATRTFAIACGVGFDAHVMRRTPAALKRRWGQPAYFMTAVALSGEIRNVPMTITVDGVSRDLEAAEVLIANMGQVMQGIRPRRDILLDDGQLDLVVVQASGPFEGLLAVWEAFRHPGPEDRPVAASSGCAPRRRGSRRLRRCPSRPMAIRPVGPRSRCRCCPRPSRSAFRNNA